MCDKEFAFRVSVQPTKKQASVIRVFTDPGIIQKVKDLLEPEEVELKMCWCMMVEHFRLHINIT